MMAAWARGHGGQAFHAVADSLTNLRHQLLLPRPAGHEDLLAYWQRVLNLAQVPADGDRDHLTREPEASEHRGQAGGRHRTSLLPAAIDRGNSAPGRCRAPGGTRCQRDCDEQEP